MAVLSAGSDTADYGHLRALISEMAGRVIVSSDYAVTATFKDAAEALACALRAQATGRGDVRIAVTTGQVSTGGLYAAGPGPILVEHLRRVAPPGGIALPVELYEELANQMGLTAVPLAQPVLGELPEPVHVMTIPAHLCQAWQPPAEVAPEPVPDPRISLAIIPFRVTGSQTASVADTTTDDVIRLLGGASGWVTVNRTEAVSSWSPMVLRRMRTRFGARFVLHGAVEQERGMLRLNAELNELDTGRVLWSDHFTGAAREGSTFRDTCAPRIARAVLPLVIHRELERTALLERQAMTAQDIALRALAVIMQPERELFMAVPAWLRLAFSQPGPHAPVHYAAIVWRLMAAGQGWNTQSVRDDPSFLESAERLDRSDPISMAMLGFLQSVLHRDHALARAMLDQVIDHSPSCPSAWSLKSRVLIQAGEGEDAILNAEQAEQLPSFGIDRAWRAQGTAMAYYIGERYVEAAHRARVSAMHHPGLAQNARVLAASLVVLGRLEEARKAAQTVLAIDPAFRVGQWRLRSLLMADVRDRYAQRLRLAGLPE